MAKANVADLVSGAPFEDFQRQISPQDEPFPASVIGVPLR